MINFAEIDSWVKTILWVTHVNDAHNPAARIKYINFAIQKISETIFRNNFIFTHTFNTDWVRLEYPLPVQFSTKQIFADSVELFERRDWVLWKDALSHPSLIAIYPEKIVFPVADAKEYKILYRGNPAKISTDDPSTTQIDMPSSYEKAIIPLACYYAFRDVKDSESAAEQLNFYREEISSVAWAFMDPNENTPKRMSGNYKF